MSRAKMDPKTTIWTGLFCMVAGGLLVVIGSWFGWVPLTYGIITLLVGLVAASSVKQEDQP